MNLDELDSKDLRLLVDAAVTVLADDLGEGERDRLVDLPMARAESELTGLLDQTGADASPLMVSLTDQAGRDAASRRLVEEALSDPDMSRRVVDAYDKRKSMMALDAGIITGPVLLAIILLRLKRLKISKDGLDVQLADSKSVAWLFDLLRGAGGG